MPSGTPSAGGRLHVRAPRVLTCAEHMSSGSAHSGFPMCGTCRTPALIRFGLYHPTLHLRCRVPQSGPLTAC